MITFTISTGVIDFNGEILAKDAYSGAKGSVDDPKKVAIKSVGPIPEGYWTIGSPEDNQTTGPFSLSLTPETDTKTYGRSGFFIHGDNDARDQSASHGCIVVNRWARERISADKSRRLLVVAGDPVKKTDAMASEPS